MLRRSPFSVLFVASLLAWLLLAPTLAAAPPAVTVLTVKGAITPILANYIQRGLDDAEQRGDEALILKLDTPGGSVQVMEEIVQSLAAARLPVVVYVAPSGAMAASAGTFIVLGGHLAAMAPGTTIGAASPVGPQGENIASTEEAKTKNVLAAQVRALAQRRGEAATTWAERTVREAVAAHADEALSLGVIDLIAVDQDDLLAQLDGREVVVQGQPRVLHMAGATVRSVSMNLGEQVVQLLVDPTIAFLLLILGVNALLIELSNPGIGFAGAFGGICLILAFLGLGMLNVNFAGLALIALAFALFVLDIKVQSHGILILGGLLAFVLGGALLFNTAYGSVPWVVLLGTAGLSALVFMFLVGAGWRARFRPVAMGRETLIGQVAPVRARLQPAGQVFVNGSLWRAVALDGQPVEPGQPVRIERIDGLTLYVRRV